MIRKEVKDAKSIWVLFALAVFIILLAIFSSTSFALLENDVEVKEESELIYYLNVNYDGVDRNGVKSSDSTTSSINSGIITVEDKIPDGLEFTGFVTTKDGSIGAVKRNDDNSICTGKVIDDTNDASTSSGTWNSEKTEYTYHGLHYSTSTRTVTFKVKNLNAGCKLTVGIKTKTPTIDDPTTTVKETRRDFYNFASAREKGLTTNSNTVHVFMGSETVALYNVKYTYTGTVPDSAPAEPTTSTYASSNKVGVAANPEIEGYTFSGWTTSDVTVSNNSFTMPEKNVTFKGSFTKNTNQYKVTYAISGTIPDGYSVPLEKNYYEGSSVTLDTLKAGDVVNGYRFLGWSTSDVTLNTETDSEFVMPSKNVALVGSFEVIKFKVNYAFNSGTLPPNSEQYLPDVQEYKAGDSVVLSSVKSVPSGYKFLGWNKETTFEMPDNDITVYGEWQEDSGTFQPTISKAVSNNKTYFRVGDVVKFKITVKNTASFAIKNVVVKEKNDTFFESGDGYTTSSEHVAEIASIPANSSVDLYANYTVSSSDSGTVSNVSEIKGALSENNYQLASADYTATTSFKIQSKLKICKNVSTNYNENTFQFHITGTSNNYETWVTLKNNQCDTIYLDAGTYKIKEVVPQEYNIKAVTGAITSDNSILTVEESKNYEVTYTNEFVKKGFLHSFGRVVNKIVQGDV